MQTPVQRLSELLELENTLEYKARQQAYAVAKDLTVALIMQPLGEGDQSIAALDATDMFLQIVDGITEKMIQDGKALESKSQVDSNTGTQD